MGLCVCAIAMSLCPEALGTESVRDELSRQQRETGLTFAWIDRDGVKGIEFANQSVVPVNDISRSAFEPIGFNFRDFGVYASRVCWSHDQTKLFGRADISGIQTLLLVNRQSNKTTTVAGNAPFADVVTPQCWSRDDRKIVYQLNGEVRIFDTESAASSPLARGTEPSWSPDGKWISFLHRGSYYAIRPDGTGRKRLFHKSGAQSPLYWTSDSRIVAYVRQLSFPFETRIIDVEVYGLRVRRLADGSDEPLCPDMNMGSLNYQWVTSAEIMNRPNSRISTSKQP
jgi:WD40 repeat protein